MLPKPKGWEDKPKHDNNNDICNNRRDDINRRDNNKEY